MKSSTTRLVASLIALIVIVGAVFAYALRGGSSKGSSIDTPVTTPIASTTPGDVTASPQDTNTGKYKNGVYQATGSYRSPAGPETVSVSLTLVDGIITDSTVTPHATNRTSIRYQTMFADNYKTLVVGKDISTLKLDRVSGSSLTPVGFNDALNQIKTEAAQA